MIKILILLTSFLTFSAANAGGGAVIVGNAGNAIKCSGADSFQSLDYILTQGMLGKDVQTVRVQNLNQSLQRIAKLIAIKIPNLSNSFKEFIELSLIKNTDDSKTYVWQERKDDDFEIVDNESFDIPFSCRKTSGSTELAQAITRKVISKNDHFKQVILKYNERVILDLESLYPINMSFLLVHEWLWNITKNPNNNRKLNYFLHSTLFDKMSADETSLFIQDLMK